MSWNMRLDDTSVAVVVEQIQRKIKQKCELRTTLALFFTRARRKASFLEFHSAIQEDTYVLIPLHL